MLACVHSHPLPSATSWFLPTSSFMPSQNVVLAFLVICNDLFTCLFPLVVYKPLEGRDWVVLVISPQHKAQCSNVVLNVWVNMILIHSLPTATPPRAPSNELHSLHSLPILLFWEPILYQALTLPRAECWVKIRADLELWLPPWSLLYSEVTQAVNSRNCCTVEG